MRCFPAAVFCLLLNASVSQADVPAFGIRSQAVVVPTVSRPVNPPPEYLLTPPVPPGTGPVWRTAQEDALREAVFRYLIDNIREPFGQDKTKRFSVCYLSVEGGKDPNPALLERLRNGRLPVRPISALRPRSRNWISFQVSAFHWTDDSNVKVEAVAPQPGFLSSWYLTYTLALHNGWWEIAGGMEFSA